ncbi:helix-turn-helix domain-containing protein [Aquipseudomonas alcaligenes]|uniref:helix-turn-helix domain-containing protein n=1 Tax=Aquipseudomonas alcaligenes TaxID=43263 RepID=UPI0037495D32
MSSQTTVDFKKKPLIMEHETQLLSGWTTDYSRLRGQCKRLEKIMDLAGFIASMRERQELSFRELEKRAGDLDHAYIWRLEKGNKQAPSDDVVSRLGQALGLGHREAEVFKLLAKPVTIDDALYRLMMSREDIPWDVFEDAATMSFRGERPNTEEAWLKRVELIQQM